MVVPEGRKEPTSSKTVSRLKGVTRVRIPPPPLLQPASASEAESVWLRKSALRVERERTHPSGGTMIVLGVILIILGALLDIGILYTIGAILAVIGVVLWILGAIGRPFAGRRYYY